MKISPFYYDLAPDVTAFSTTRHGGYGSGNYAGFNINRYCGDAETAIAANQKLLCEALNLDGTAQIVMPHQTHGTEVRIIDEAFMALPVAERLPVLEGVDALMTDVPGVCIGVSTADCIPIIIYDPQHRAACAVHAGWRGTVAGIARRAVEAMQRAYGSVPGVLRAAIGPGISLENFEVGDEVYGQFAAAGHDMARISRPFAVPAQTEERGWKWHIDLPECNKMQLQAAGLQPENVLLSGVCTYEAVADYFSARRLGIRSGRIFTGVVIKKK